MVVVSLSLEYGWSRSSLVESGSDAFLVLPPFLCRPAGRDAQSGEYSTGPGFSIATSALKTPDDLVFF